MLNGLVLVLTLCYPFLVYAAIDHVQPRYLALLLAVVMLLRWQGGQGRKLGRAAFFLGGAGLGFLLIVSLVNDDTLLLGYPVFVNILFFTAFFYSVLNPPTIVECLARLREPDLPPRGVRYTYKVTVVWCMFFLVNGAISAATIWYGDKFIWSLFNGLISYLLMGLLMGAEMLVRARVRRAA